MGKLRATVFAKIPRAALAQALEDIRAMVRPPDDVYYGELVGRYRSVRGFLPVLLINLKAKTRFRWHTLGVAAKWHPPTACALYCQYVPYMPDLIQTQPARRPFSGRKAV
jgi:hypothetical protein